MGTSANLRSSAGVAAIQEFLLFWLSMSVPGWLGVPYGLPVVLAMFSAIFWLSRQLKWRNSKKMAPVPAGFDQVNRGLHRPLPPSSVVSCR